MVVLHAGRQESVLPEWVHSVQCSAFPRSDQTFRMASRPSARLVVDAGDRLGHHLFGTLPPNSNKQLNNGRALGIEPHRCGRGGYGQVADISQPAPSAERRFLAISRWSLEESTGQSEKKKRLHKRTEMANN